MHWFHVLKPHIFYNSRKWLFLHFASWLNESTRQYARGEYTKTSLHWQFKCYIVWHYFVKFSQAFLILFIKFCTEKFSYKNMSEIFFPQCLPQHFKHQKKKLIIKGIQRKTKWFFVFICTTFSLRSTKKKQTKSSPFKLSFWLFRWWAKRKHWKISFFLPLFCEWVILKKEFFLRILWLISRLFIHRFLYVMRGAKIKRGEQEVR